jgi:hypothetical protein
VHPTTTGTSCGSTFKVKCFPDSTEVKNKKNKHGFDNCLENNPTQKIDTHMKNLHASQGGDQVHELSTDKGTEMGIRIKGLAILHEAKRIQGESKFDKKRAIISERGRLAFASYQKASSSKNDDEGVADDDVDQEDELVPQKRGTEVEQASTGKKQRKASASSVPFSAAHDYDDDDDDEDDDVQMMDASDDSDDE